MLVIFIDVLLTALVIAGIAWLLGGDPWTWGFMVLAGVVMFGFYLLVNDMVARVMCALRFF